MNPVTSALLRSWGWRADVILILVLGALLYARGWRQLRRKGHGRATPLRLVSYYAGLIFVALALMSPIDVMGRQLFLMHMVQHLLLVMVAPPLLWLAEPFPMIVWGMPARARPIVVRLVSRKAGFRRFLLLFASPGIVWFLFVVAVVGWHDADAYNAALRFEWVHDLEHLSFFLMAMLFWWRLTGAAPVLTRRLGRPARIALAISAVPPNAILGAVIAFASEVIYTYYLAVPRLFGLSALEDQQLGGLIMWVPGSMMYIVAALVLIFRVLQEGNQPGPTDIASEALLAPGVKVDG
jgi:cytochrome c oxidase assembly factor CtaG